MPASPELLTGLGSAFSIFFSALGAALASAHSGTYAVQGKDYKSFIPIVVSGMLAIYGIIVSVLLVGKISDDMTDANGYRNLCAGLAVGLACLASGLGLSKFMKQCNASVQARRLIMAPRSSSGVCGNSESDDLAAPLVAAPPPVVSQEIPVIKLCMVLCYLEAIGLYGLIVALFLMG